MSEPTESPRRRRRAQAEPPPAVGSPLVGALLVAVALVIGFLLLRDDPGGTAGVDVGAGPSATPTTASVSSSSTSSTTAALRAPSAVKVLVANGSGVNGAAGTTTEELKAKGYVTGTPANLSGTGRVAATLVYFVPGFQGEALRLATEIGVPATAVAALPTPAPVDDVQGANILVVVGPDLAAAG